MGFMKKTAKKASHVIKKNNRSNGEEEKKKRIEEEKKRRIEKARKNICNDIIYKQIPRLEAIISESKKELQSLKQKHNKCHNDYTDGECSRLPEWKDRLNTNKSLYSNIKSTIINLKDAYDLEGCSSTDNCDSLFADSTLATSNYESEEKDFLSIKNKYETCNDPYKNKCASLLRDLEKSQETVNKDIMYLKSNIEEFTAIGNVAELNTNIENIQNENDKLLNRIKLVNNPSQDTHTGLDTEVCTNILLTTAGSVMLYYFFFEI
jgi:hypothetical protein